VLDVVVVVDDDDDDDVFFNFTPNIKFLITFSPSL
jgi:hypothetical protein